ncbi:universal stress protein [Spirosoma rigui]|uniref:universal stress protein n=1 Tax=Spirosoma rigui TaxID=564064 RepID=UPI0009B08D6B|nr:universal stress protein [Spirosoma rigui]
MKTIVFPTDFSDSTADALNWAKLFARQYNASLLVVHVQQLAMPNTALPVAGELGMGASVGMDVDMQQISQEQLDTLAGQLQADGIQCQTELRLGAVKDAILSVAHEQNADLIITGRGHLRNFFDRLGGTAATSVAKGANCPVLIVPASESAPKPAQLRSIVFSTPLEFDQQEGFGQTLAIARTFDATIRVLRVRAENQPSLSADKPMLKTLQNLYGAEPLPVDTIESRTVSGGIDTYLSTNSPDLLVMTTRERDFLSGLLNPSLTDRVVTHTDLPVLVFQESAPL